MHQLFEKIRAIKALLFIKLISGNLKCFTQIGHMTWGDNLFLCRAVKVFLLGFGTFHTERGIDQSLQTGGFYWFSAGFTNTVLSHIVSLQCIIHFLQIKFQQFQQSRILFPFKQFTANICRMLIIQGKFICRLLKGDHQIIFPASDCLL